MKSTPLVSAMMPCYNSGKYLAETIESVINQSYVNWELIIVDDGSTDDTKHIVNLYIKQGHNIIYKFIDHSGRGVARNECIKLCNGEYIAVCDSDDISVSNRFEKQVNFLLNNSNIGVVSSYTSKFKDSKNLDDQYLIKSPVTSEDIARCFDKKKMSVPNASSMIRRSLFDKYGMYNPKMLRAQDYEFFKRAHNDSVKFYTIPETLVFYRQENLFPSFEYYIKSLCYVRYGDYILRGGDASFDDYYKMFVPYLFKNYLTIKYYTATSFKYFMLEMMKKK